MTTSGGGDTRRRGTSKRLWGRGLALWAQFFFTSTNCPATAWIAASHQEWEAGSEVRGRLKERRRWPLARVIRDFFGNEFILVLLTPVPEPGSATQSNIIQNKIDSISSLLIHLSPSNQTQEARVRRSAALTITPEPRRTNRDSRKHAALCTVVERVVP
jgi:hypothetical protein